MMTQQVTDQNLFHQLIEGLYQQVGMDALQKMRAKAWDRYCEIGLPTRKTEPYQYVPLRRLYNRNCVLTESVDCKLEEFESFVLPECKESFLVFVNGEYAPALSCLKGVSSRAVILTLGEAMRTYGTFLNNQFAKSIKDEVDAFVAINAALHQHGAFIYLPPKTVLTSPIHVINIVKTAGETLLNPRLHVFVGSQSQIEIVTDVCVLKGDRYVLNGAMEFAIEDDAHVKVFQRSCEQPVDSWHLESLRGMLKRDSTLKTVSVTDGSDATRFDYRVALTGENAEALLNGVWMLAGKRESHAHVLMDHQAPYCRSMQLYKGVLTDVSKSSFEGKILVQQAAQKTEAFQLNNNLLLSEGAMADSKPNLEIFADDVKASHGATVGQLDKDELFYLKTRGFSDKEAKSLLVSGYCKEVIYKITVPSLVDQLVAYAETVLLKETAHG